MQIVEERRTKCVLAAKMALCAVVAFFTTPLGAAFRALAAKMQKHPFIHISLHLPPKTLPPHLSFSLLSWNVCCVAGGYPISDGGVLPWSLRIDGIIDKIIENDPDVTCLYETFDTKSAFYICDALKSHGYRHFYFNIGPKAIGVSSGILVASKYAIQNPEFSPFPQEALVGRTKFAAKGMFAFDLESEGNVFASIHATHMQHSEEPQFPTLEEVQAREKQMKMIVDKVCAVKDRCAIVTGDLNLDREEYEASSWHHVFQKGDDFKGANTYGGDAFSAILVGKRISGPLDLDHTMVLKGSVRFLKTSLVETRYNPLKVEKEALSDHRGQFVEVIIRPLSNP